MDQRCIAGAMLSKVQRHLSDTSVSSHRHVGLAEHCHCTQFCEEYVQSRQGAILPWPTARYCSGFNSMWSHRSRFAKPCGFCQEGRQQVYGLGPSMGVFKPCILGAGKKKKGKHSKAKPAPADDDDIDAILAEIGEAPSEKAAPPADADAEVQPGERAHTDIDSLDGGPMEFLAVDHLSMSLHTKRCKSIVATNWICNCLMLGWQSRFYSACKSVMSIHFDSGLLAIFSAWGSNKAGIYHEFQDC